MRSLDTTLSNYLTLSPALLNTSTAVKCKRGEVTQIRVTLLLWMSQFSHSEAVKEIFILCNKWFLMLRV